MSTKKKVLIGVALGVVLAAVVILNVAGKKEKAIEIQSEKVKRGDVVKTVTASGKIQPVTDVKISSNVSARIMKMTVKEGDKVKKGQLLVSLDRTIYEAAVNQAKAEVLRANSNVLSAKAGLLKSQQDFSRVKGLFDKALSSEAEMQSAQAALSTAQSQFEAAESQVQAAQAQLEQSLDNYSKTEIYSPIDGTVSQLSKEIGEIALGSQFSQDVIMVIANLADMEARVQVDENDVVSISMLDSAVIEVDALNDQKLKGQVSEIANSATVSAAGTQEEKTEFEVKIALLDNPITLRPGMSTTAEVTTDVKKNVVNVPIQCVTVREPDKLKRKEGVEKDAAMANDSGEFKANKDGVVEIVFVVENGVAVARAVKTGIQSESHIEVTEGLKEGDEVVVGPYRAISKLLENGSKVTVDNNKKKTRTEMSGEDDK
ncbi:MAG: efflux RND transporter periplasmic adaptor subunit [Bacteroidetes bacterium]|nr:efflux RND transporter periplasmic adaptor subunit [Bacteroidota bacterium]